MARTCVKCGAMLDDDEIFCGECGAKYEEQQKENGDGQAAGFCSKCGERIRQGCAFCTKCGAPVAGGALHTPMSSAQTVFAGAPAQGYTDLPAKKTNKTAIVIAAIAAVTIVAVLLILLLSGVFEGGNQTGLDIPVPAGTTIEGTDGDDVITIDSGEETTIEGTEGDDVITIDGNDDDTSTVQPGGVLAWPTDGYATLIPVLPYGTLSEVRDLGSGSYAIVHVGVTPEQGLSYLQDQIIPAGFSLNQQEDNTTSRYAFRSYNADGVMFELVCEGNNAGVYIGEAY